VSPYFFRRFIAKLGEHFSARIETTEFLDDKKTSTNC
jgi:hypothetical protein